FTIVIIVSFSFRVRPFSLLLVISLSLLSLILFSLLLVLLIPLLPIFLLITLSYIK
ncbi:unnamed protein product, partial [Sphagnum balticum]